MPSITKKSNTKKSKPPEYAPISDAVLADLIADWSNYVSGRGKRTCDALRELRDRRAKDSSRAMLSKEQLQALEIAKAVPSELPLTVVTPAGAKFRGLMPSRKG